ncbi:MAG: imidazoleglycerol-phosphate dehydratase HisB [Clostridia bacterium]|nr:imidazoleglycerol-phosphate dehydratase HisB [Clostridia bacterium]
MRAYQWNRTTTETDIALELNLDGNGISAIQTGVGFLDHMLTLFAKHGRFDLKISCKGDTYVDDHHTVEDIGIALGVAFKNALGNKKGICRYGSTLLPMDEALILSAVDISGRGGCYYALQIPTEKVGTFDTQLCKEFWIAFASNAGITLHLRREAGENSHHIIEGAFKSVARSLRTAVSVDPAFAEDIPSTKGLLA